MSGRFINAALFLLCVLSTVVVGCEQAVTKTRISKAQALKNVRVTPAGGWKEALTDEGRFRILFPGEPTATVEGPLSGFKFSDDVMKNWYAYHTDADNMVEHDDALREVYRQSIEALTKKGATLVSLNDVRLNGKLGAEFVLISPHKTTKSYMRVFQVGRKIYTLAVDDRSQSFEERVTPPEVRLFFDSFTFWEIT